MCDANIWRDSADRKPYVPTCYKNGKIISCLINEDLQESALLQFEPSKCYLIKTDNVNCTSMNNNSCNIKSHSKEIRFQPKFDLA